MAKVATILIVDDMAILRELIAAGLTAAGYVVRTAGGAREALESARTETPTLVLLEPATGGGEGLKFLKAMRAHPMLTGVPVMVLTASADRPVILAAAKLRVHDYILKGRSSMQNLLERVERCVRGELLPLGMVAGAGLGARAAQVAPLRK
ncbi:MAG: adenylate/guanylate cyclase response regulator, partial [Phycisphaerales bacterium]|nr:adenylate/guanylate cyclase response regulator [Phycisphaerales bacterium]